jgi:hypothetical protein
LLADGKLCFTAFTLGRAWSWLAYLLHSTLWNGRQNVQELGIILVINTKEYTHVNDTCSIAGRERSCLLLGAVVHGFDRLWRLALQRRSRLVGPDWLSPTQHMVQLLFSS